MNAVAMAQLSGRVLVDTISRRTMTRSRCRNEASIKSVVEIAEDVIFLQRSRLAVTAGAAPLCCAALLPSRLRTPVKGPDPVQLWPLVLSLEILTRAVDLKMTRMFDLSRVLEHRPRHCLYFQKRFSSRSRGECMSNIVFC